METKNWLEQIAQTIDSKDAEGFANYMTENGVFRFGSQPHVEGRENIKNYVAEFFNMINSCSHSINRFWKDNGTVIWQGTVTYKRLDDKMVDVEFVNVFNLEDNLIKDYLIYIDNSPLFAQ